MKLLFFFALVPGLLFADPPTAILKAFETDYPGAKVLEWEAEHGGWEVEFRWKGQEREAFYTLAGVEANAEEEEAASAVPPAAVQAAFRKQFPNATEVEWEQENGFVWEAEFAQEGQELEAIYWKDGRFIATERDIAVAELPAAVRAKLEQLTILEAEEYTMPSGSRAYGVEIKTQNGKTEERFFQADGGPAKNPEAAY